MVRLDIAAWSANARLLTDPLPGFILTETEIDVIEQEVRSLQSQLDEVHEKVRLALGPVSVAGGLKEKVALLRDLYQNANEEAARHRKTISDFARQRGSSTDDIEHLRQRIGETLSPVALPPGGVKAALDLLCDLYKSAIRDAARNRDALWPSRPDGDDLFDSAAAHKQALRDFLANDLKPEPQRLALRALCTLTLEALR